MCPVYPVTYLPGCFVAGERRADWLEWSPGHLLPLEYQALVAFAEAVLHVAGHRERLPVGRQVPVLVEAGVDHEQLGGRDEAEAAAVPGHDGLDLAAVDLVHGRRTV